MQILKTSLLIVTVLSLGACGGGGSGGAGSGEGGGNSMSKTTKGRGDITFVGHISSEKRQRLALDTGSEYGEVHCELTPKGWGIVSLGTFYKADWGLNTSQPLTGLSVTIPDVRGKDSKMTNQAFLNVENSRVTQPTCTYFPANDGSPGIRGSVQCTDSEDRAGWGRMTITAHFSCEG